MTVNHRGSLSGRAHDGHAAVPTTSSHGRRVTFLIAPHRASALLRAGQEVGLGAQKTPSPSALEPSR